MQRLVSIQHLRGLAVLGVVVFHAFQWEWLNFETGSGGVDLFFIISGFVLARTYERAMPATLDFAVLRFRRLWAPVAAGSAEGWQGALRPRVPTWCSAMWQ